MSEMVERAERAVINKIGVPDAALARSIVRVVIAELREPTEAMIAALLRDKFLDASDHNRDAVTLDWQVMMDAAFAKNA